MWTYVYDITVSTVSESIPKGQQSKSQEAVEAIYDWSKENLFQLNGEKTKELVIFLRMYQLFTRLRLSCFPLQFTNESIYKSSSKACKEGPYHAFFLGCTTRTPFSQQGLNPSGPMHQENLTEDLFKFIVNDPRSKITSLPPPLVSISYELRRQRRFAMPPLIKTNRFGNSSIVKSVRKAFK